MGKALAWHLCNLASTATTTATDAFFLAAATAAVLVAEAPHLATRGGGSTVFFRDRTASPSKELPSAVLCRFVVLPTPHPATRDRFTAKFRIPMSPSGRGTGLHATAGADISCSAGNLPLELRRRGLNRKGSAIEFRRYWLINGARNGFPDSTEPGWL